MVIQNIARIFLGIFMSYAGIAHLTFSRIEFRAEVPTWLTQNIYFADFIVLASGVVEIILGLSIIFLIKYKRNIGILLAIFFVIVYPGNISQYINNINAFGLDTDFKRLVRLFFQPILILWALWSTGFFNKKIIK